VQILRTWRGRFIVAFIVLQLAIPLRYYVGHRDPRDERFAWRMFSPMRMAQCKPTFKLDGTAINPYTEFHEAWNELAERGRFTVIEAMGAELCKRHPKSEVRVSLDCTYVGRDPESFGGYNMCTVPEL
jgi:hypothetical protein